MDARLVPVSSLRLGSAHCGNSPVVTALHLVMITSETPMRLAAFGDSIAFGQGASDPSHTIGVRLVVGLQRTGTPTVLRVFAVPRARSDALDAQVRAARGWRPHLAGDHRRRQRPHPFVPPDQAVAALGAAVRDLRENGWRARRRPCAGPERGPRVPPEWQTLVRSVSGSLRAGQVRAATAAGARVADADGLTAAVFAADPNLFSADRFHPSSAGYALIAAAIEPAVRAAAAEVGAGRSD